VRKERREGGNGKKVFLQVQKEKTRRAAGQKEADKKEKKKGGKGDPHRSEEKNFPLGEREEKNLFGTLFGGKGFKALRREKGRGVPPERRKSTTIAKQKRDHELWELGREKRNSKDIGGKKTWAGLLWFIDMGQNSTYLKKLFFTGLGFQKNLGRSKGAKGSF